MEYQIQQVVTQLFPRYDRDHSGSLQANELADFLTAALKKLGINSNVTQTQAQQALKIIDKNSDQKISKLEVQAALKSILDYKQRKENPGSNGGNWQNPPNNGWEQNNGWGNQPTPNNSYGGPGNYGGNNGWDQPPPQNNGWGPSPSYNSNGWGYEQPPPYNNSWPTPHQTPGSWNQPTFNNTWGHAPPQNMSDGWGSTQFNSQNDYQMKRLIDQLYQRYDRDRSGGLDKNELVGAFNQLLRDLGVSMRITPSQASSLIRAVDNSHDGKVQKGQFFKMLKYLLADTEDSSGW